MTPGDHPPAIPEAPLRERGGGRFGRAADRPGAGPRETARLSKGDALVLRIPREWVDENPALLARIADELELSLPPLGIASFVLSDAIHVQIVRAAEEPDGIP